MLILSRKSFILFAYIAIISFTSIVKVNAQAPLPFDKPSTATLRASSRKVFAHYVNLFVVSEDNADPIADYYQTQWLTPSGENNKWLNVGGFLRERPWPRAPRPQANWPDLDLQLDVQRAIATGIDGFSIDILSYGANDSGWIRYKSLMAAAHTVDPGFSIMLVPDMTGMFGPSSDPNGTLLAQMVVEASNTANYPSVFHLPDGRLVLSPYLAQVNSLTWWTNWLAMMRNSYGIDIAFVPQFQGFWNYQSWAPICYGMTDWGSRCVSSNGAPNTWNLMAKQIHAWGVPVCMAPVAPQDMRPKNLQFTEASNTEDYRVMWNNALYGDNSGASAKADWVQLVTWNDYSEHTEVQPSSGTQFLFNDLAAYYITLMKTGTAPITRDVLFYCHRIETTTAPYDTNKQSAAFSPQGGQTPDNQIELLAFMTAAGTLKIQTSAGASTLSAPAGITSFKVPLTSSINGKPVFSLIRSGATIASVTSQFPIVTSLTYQDLLYRGGSSLRAIAGVVNDTDSLIAYNGTWPYLGNRGIGDYQNDIHYTTTNNNTLKYSFVGTGIDYITEMFSDEGNVSFYVDGTFVATVSCSSATRLVQQPVVHVTGLPFGIHTLTAVKASGTYMLLDALKVYMQ